MLSSSNVFDVKCTKSDYWKRIIRKKKISSILVWNIFGIKILVKNFRLPRSLGQWSSVGHKV